MSFLNDAFISYGRADSKEFAKKLHDRLAQEGLKVWFDFNDIPLGVDYQNQIDEGIEQADNFLYIIAPHSVNSPYCGKEVDLALKLNKRIIPLLHVEQISREVWQHRFPGKGDAEWQDYIEKGKHSSFPNMHPEIAKINWIYCRERIDDFEQAFQGLQTLLLRQQPYVRQHTLFLDKALEWERQQKQSRYLLVGDDRQQAESWLKLRFKEEQPPCIPTDLHCEFITESAKNSQNLMTQVFLSYAEEEIAIMEKVRRSLRREGFTVWTNKTDIQTGVDFQEAINRGVEEADNLVYLLSPASLRSPYCQQEIDYALSLNKRIIPLLVQPTDLEQVSPVLRGLQYIDLTDNIVEVDYQQDESQLLRVLRQDAAYYEEHKVLLTRALKWQRQHQNPSVLLRGYNLQHGEAWLKIAQSRAQHPSLPIQADFIAASLQQPPAMSLDVFVSYSRADSDFARKLNDALQVQGKTTWFDQESIASGADFQREIYRGIENSNNFLFVISPNAVSSPYCADEVEYAQKLNKRIVTVLHRPVEPKELHPVLAAVQWIDFGQREGDFSANFKEVLRTIDTDPVHLQTHTRLLVRAIEWDSKGRNESLLLRGDDLDDAEKWAAESADRDPKPTSLQHDYVSSSRSLEAANRQASEILEAAAKKGQRRVLIGTSVMAIGLVVASIAGFFAYKAQEHANAADIKANAADTQAKAADTKAEKADTQAKQAKQQEQAAKQQAIVAKEQVTQAEVKEKQAQVRLNQAAIAVKAAEKQKQVAEQQVTLAQQNLQTASVKTAQAEQQFQQAQQQIVLAQRSLNQAQVAQRKAQVAQKEAQKGSVLERQGSNALNQFEARPLETLVEAVKTGQELKSLVKDGRFLEKYPAVAPLLALQVILNEIKEQKRLFYPDGVRQVSLSRSGKMILASLVNGTVQVRDLTGQKIGEIKESALFSDVSFSPDDQRILTVENGSVRLWDLSGQMITELKETKGQNISGASFSPDGKSIVTAQYGNTFKVWDSAGHKVSEFTTGQVSLGDDVPIARFSPDGKSILTSSNGTTQLSDLSGHKIAEIPANNAANASFSPDGKSILTVSKNTLVQVWDLSGRKIVEFNGYKDQLTFPYFNPSAHFSPDGKYIVTASGGRTARVWDLLGHQISELEGHQDQVNDAYFSPDGKFIVTSSNDKTVRLWNFSDQTTKLKLSESYLLSPDQVLDWIGSLISYSPDGQHIFVSNAAEIWSQSGKQLAKLKDLSGQILASSFSADGKRIVTALSDNTIQVWDLTGSRLIKLSAPQKSIRLPQVIRGVSLSPDGQRVAVTSSNGYVYIWDMSGKKIAEQTIKADLGDVNFSPDGQSLVVASKNGNSYVLGLTGAQIIALKGHQGGVMNASFSPNGRRIVTASADETARVWDLSGHVLTQLKGHQGKVNSASFSPDGQRIVTASADGTVQVWDLQGRAIAEYTNFGMEVIRAGFSSNGQRIIATTVDSTLQVLQADNLDSLLSKACSRLGDYLKEKPDLPESDRRLCDDVTATTPKSK